MPTIADAQRELIQLAEGIAARKGINPVAAVVQARRQRPDLFALVDPPTPSPPAARAPAVSFAENSPAPCRGA